MNWVSLVRQDGLHPLHHLTAVQNRTVEIILCSLSGHVQPSKGKTRDCEEVKPSGSCGLNTPSMWVAVFPVDAENMIAITSTELPSSFAQGCLVVLMASYFTAFWLKITLRVHNMLQ